MTLISFVVPPTGSRVPARVPRLDLRSVRRATSRSSRVDDCSPDHSGEILAEYARPATRGYGCHPRPQRRPRRGPQRRARRGPRRVRLVPRRRRLARRRRARRRSAERLRGHRPGRAGGRPRPGGWRRPGPAPAGKMLLRRRRPPVFSAGATAAGARRCCTWPGTRWSAASFLVRLGLGSRPAGTRTCRSPTRCWWPPSGSAGWTGSASLPAAAHRRDHPDRAASGTSRSSTTGRRVFDHARRSRRPEAERCRP